MKKKALAMILAAAMVLGVTACGSSEAPATAPTEEASASGDEAQEGETPAGDEAAPAGESKDIMFVTTGIFASLALPNTSVACSVSRITVMIPSALFVTAVSRS